MTFLNAAFLFGLAALAIPPLVHLLNRRRYETVPWAAVMFLPESTTTRRRFRFQHLPLMLLRMGLLSLLAIAFAAPQFAGCHATTANRGSPRDVLVLIDGSASMACGPPGRTPADRAKEYLRSLIETKHPQQRIAIRTVNHRTWPVLEGFTLDRTTALNSLELIPPPSGTADWPSAIQQAEALLEAGRGEVVVLTDDQRFGWADPPTLAKWMLLAHAAGKPFPIFVVGIPADPVAEAANARLEPIRTDRGTAVAGREIRFRSAIRFAKAPPSITLRVSVDGSPVGTLNFAPREGETRLPIDVAHRFPAGSHVLTLELPEDPFPGDNRQDFAIEVLPIIPVLIIDGGSPGSRFGGGFLRDALAPSKDDSPAFAVRSISAKDWEPGVLQRTLEGSAAAPRVVALVNVEKPTADQAREIERFLREGGGAFIALGENCDAAGWNRVAYRGGEGFLPVRILAVTEASGPAPPRLMPSGFSHSALEIFRDPLPGGLGTAVFPRYWKLDPDSGIRGTTGTAIASLTNGDPWLVESPSGLGKVVACAHPLDDSWGTNLHRLPDFVRLSHELFYFLAGTRAARRNLLPGQPLLFRPAGNEPPGDLRIRSPDGRVRTIAANAWPWSVDLDDEPGAYQVTTSLGRQSWFAMGHDPGESDFARNSGDDRARVAETLGPIEYRTESEPLQLPRFEPGSNRDVGWIALGLVCAMLLAEVVATRRLVRTGAHAVPEAAGP